MKRFIPVVVVVLLIGGAAGGAWWGMIKHPQTWTQLQTRIAQIASGLGLGTQENPNELIASGFIEAEEVSVAAELGGRIVTLGAAEGDEVVEGQVVVELDDSLLRAQIEQAQADVAVAEAALAQVRAGARPEALDSAQAQLLQAQVAEEASRVAWEDAKAMLDNPQQLGLALTAAQSQLGVLNFQERQAQAMANSAQAGRDLADTAVQMLESFEPYDEWIPVGTFTADSLPFDIPLPSGLEGGEYRWKRYKLIIHGDAIELWYLAQIKLSPDALPGARYEQAAATYQSWTAWTTLAQAQAARQGTKSYLAELTEQQANPLTLQAGANAAESQLQIAGAAVAMAQAQVDGLKMGATPEQIAAAEAQVEIAQAALEALRVQLARFTLQAPIAGLVLERPVHVGEVAAPGMSLMTLADLNNLTLTLYVPESELGKIGIGQAVSVTVDAYPGRTFTGTIAYIASEAEFTPKNVQTREERVNLVFAVRVRLPNPDHALKPGMPADAIVSTKG